MEKSPADPADGQLHDRTLHRRHGAPHARRRLDHRDPGLRASARCPAREQSELNRAAQGMVAAGQARGLPLRLFFLSRLRSGRAFGVGDQLLDLLTAFVTDLFVEVGTVLFLDDLAAFLADRLVEAGAMTLPGRLTALAADLFVEPRTIAVP